MSIGEFYNLKLRIFGRVGKRGQNRLPDPFVEKKYSRKLVKPFLQELSLRQDSLLEHPGELIQDWDWDFLDPGLKPVPQTVLFQVHQ